MKHSISHIAGYTALAAATVLFAAATLAGCSAADDPPQPELPERGTLAVEVADKGYGAEESRTAEVGWRTEFTVGDRVGLYVVKGGNVTTDNLCLTLDQNGKWTKQTVQPLYYDSKAAYYAYYPWQADMTGKTDPAAANAEGFFAPLVADWTPAADQSSHEAYTAWDLMTCTGTVGVVQADGTRPLTLGMTHRMAVAAIELPGMKYVTADNFAYTTPAVEAEFTWGGAVCKPYLTDGVYRILYNPQSPAQVSGSYNSAGTGKIFDFTPNVSAGGYKTYRVDGGLADGGERALKPGDLYYADGSILPAETAAQYGPGTAPKGCIGIVFQTDLSRISTAEKALFAAEGKTVHGLAMSVKSVGNNSTCAWYYNRSLTGAGMYTRDESAEDPNYPGYVLPHIYDADYAKCYTLADADINGYFNTEVIKVRRSADLAAGRYPAFKAAVNFTTEAGGPKQGVFTTGWYLPSSGQWFDFLRNIAGANLGAGNLIDWGDGDFFWENIGDVLALLNGAMSAIPEGDKTAYVSGVDGFWTSSGASPSHARRVDILVDILGDDGLGCLMGGKRYVNYVRCVLAF